MPALIDFSNPVVVVGVIIGILVFAVYLDTRIHWTDKLGLGPVGTEEEKKEGWTEINPESLLEFWNMGDESHYDVKAYRVAKEDKTINWKRYEFRLEEMKDPVAADNTQLQMEVTPNSIKGYARRLLFFPKGTENALRSQIQHLQKLLEDKDTALATRDEEMSRLHESAEEQLIQAERHRGRVRRERALQPRKQYEYSKDKDEEKGEDEEGI